VVTVAIIIMIFLGVAALIGAIIALIASRRAQDGFQDQDGFHAGELPPRFRPK
jgi:hypothetical protein